MAKLIAATTGADLLGPARARKSESTLTTHCAAVSLAVRQNCEVSIHTKRHPQCLAFPQLARAGGVARRIGMSSVVGKVEVTPSRARIASLGRRATTLPSPARPRRSAFHVVSQRTARLPRRRPPGKTSRPLAAPRERGSLEVEVESSEAALPTARADKGDGLAGISLAGVPLTPEVSAIVLVYFVQGILGLSRLCLLYTSDAADE